MIKYGARDCDVALPALDSSDQVSKLLTGARPDRLGFPAGDGDRGEEGEMNGGTLSTRSQAGFALASGLGPAWRTRRMCSQLRLPTYPHFVQEDV